LRGDDGSDVTGGRVTGTVVGEGEKVSVPLWGHILGSA